MGLAGALNDIGTTKWVISKIALFYESVNIMNKYALLAIFCAFFFYAHYFFVSTTAFVAVMYATFLGIFIQIGLPPVPSAFCLAYLSVLSAGLTHYGINSAPIIFGAGHVSILSWWKVSLVISTVNLLIWAVTGGIWWRILGWI
jgi:divalent anion:Na+ symporter, DASS family